VAPQAAEAIDLAIAGALGYQSRVFKFRFKASIANSKVAMNLQDLAGAASNSN
jgi:hypothetical protein